MIYSFAALLLLAPLYVWRFGLAGQPVNFLMLAASVVLLVGIAHIVYTKRTGDLYNKLIALPTALVVGVVGLLVAAIGALFVNGADAAKAAQVLVLFVQPIALAALLYYYRLQYGGRRVILWSAFIFVGVSGMLALLQYFFLITLPPAWWGNSNEPKRAIAFFVHPNNYSLFIAPLLAYLLPALFERVSGLWEASERWWSVVFAVVLWLLGSVGLLLSLSRGGWIGLLAAVGIFVLLKANKKLLLGTALGLIIIAGVVAAVPNLRYRVLLPFQGEKSSVARFSLWETGWKMISDKPLTGQGAHGFNYNWDKFNTDKGLDHYNFPHNIVLNFWVDYGLLGLVSFLLIIFWAVWQGWVHRAKPYALGFALFAIALTLHGLIDIPYLKNDLALVFWLMLALSVETKNT